jgi:hypothetical protein
VIDLATNHKGKTKMKQIKICQKNAGKIMDILRQVNGRANSFTLKFYSEVELASQKAEAQLSALPKHKRAGAVCNFIPEGPSAAAYKYSAKSTEIEMVRRSRDWFLISAEARSVYPCDPENSQVTISPDQADEIKSRAVQNFIISEACA